MGSVGFVVSGVLVLAFLGGREIDSWLGTKPIFMMVLMFVSLIGLVVWFFQMYSRMKKEKDDE